MIKVIVAGGRYFTNYAMLKEKLNNILANQKKENIEIVSGCCDTGKVTYNRPDGTIVCGADGLGERYAAEKGLNVVYMKPDWDKHGKAAGQIRNQAMADYATHCICFWDGVSKGTEGMIEKAQLKRIPTRVIMYQRQEKDL